MRDRCFALVVGASAGYGVAVLPYPTMKMPRFPVVSTVARAVALTAVLACQLAAGGEKDGQVKLGDDGLPPHWLQGEPITAMEKDKLYIFEFWATWCGPCIVQMPHIESLYQATKADKNIEIIGVNVFDATPVEKLKAFIAKKKINYPVAADGARSGKVAKAWLKPLGVSGIPHAIAVRNHKLLWAGHPAKLNLALIRRMSKPGYRPAPAQPDAAKKAAEAKAADEHFAKVQSIYRQPVDGVAAHTDKLVAGKHRGDDDIISYRTAAFKALFLKGKHREAQQQLRKLAAETPDSAYAMIRIAAVITTTDELSHKDLALAVKCLERNIELSPKTASIAYQRMTDAKLMQGDRAGALESAQKAVETSLQQRALDNHLKELGGRGK